MQFIVLTDPHLVPPGERLYGLDPGERLRQAVAAINASHQVIDVVVVTGDLVHRGDVASYEYLAALIGEAKAPVLLLAGNHDRRGPLHAVLPKACRDAAGFVQGVHEHEAATLVTLDTLDEDSRSGDGVLCERRLAFLEEALGNARRDKPLLLFQHHPPFATGLKAMDAVQLRNGEAEWEVMARTRKPDLLFTGHLHRPISGVWRGIPFQVLRGISHQVGFDLECESHVPGSHEAPDYALVTIRDGTIVSHQISYAYAGPTFSLNDRAAERAREPELLPRLP